ncbi:WcbI family polysaccharide biosynthesis putative acetyltransferase [Synechococcus sp. ROS8604]|uniref:WcbI family polysaccharide biosynthesis putative acetyltransferase n=1 Tax=Synechococcus sp. ROS8604 TaxID=1442557 RepID=UPI0016463617|nr:WcbI family polysaccharide biosynthesis putative acetyltransferase [Synechococcus sp. ROS8604]QNI86906.1 hypothetical protein SynROS8604_00235 [Synechococcus sp. ROS8604]
MKLLLIGNCQIVAISKVIEDAYSHEIILNKIIIHKTNPSLVEQYAEELSQSDLIISQLIKNKNYPSVLSSDYIKNCHPQKCIFIPNSYFRGYNPDLIYLKYEGLRLVDTPLHDYHSNIIYKGWKKSLSEKETLNLLNDSTTWEKLYKTVASQSFEELKSREVSCDIKISEFLEKNMSHSVLFHTFNHPSNKLLAEIAAQLIQMIEIKTGVIAKNKYKALDRFSVGHEALGKIRTPVHPYVKNQLKLNIPITQNNDLIYRIGKKGEPENLSAKVLVKRFYSYYKTAIN